MNTLRIIVQSRDDLKNLLSTEEKIKKFPEGVTLVIIEAATKGGQLGFEFINKGEDIYGKQTVMGFALTENNMEGMMGGLIGARMRFGRMPKDEYELVRHYVKDQVKRFLDTLDVEKRSVIEIDIRKFFIL